MLADGGRIASPTNASAEGPGRHRRDARPTRKGLDRVGGLLADVQQTTEGHAPAAAPMVSARCGRGGRLAGSTGAGKDWQCVISNQVNGRTTQTRYDVVARPTACYIATSPDFGAQFIRTATGKQTANPLYQFDGCLPG